MKITTSKIKYFLYARKSSESEDRQMASIQSQIDELTKLAKQHNLEVVRIFSEAKSAKEPGREIFNDMMLRIEKGEATGIICWKLNRLARNPIDGGKVSWMLQQGIVEHIQTQGRCFYPTDNVIVMAVELGMANQFIRDLSVDTKRGLKTKAERGWYPTYTTLGYMHNPIKQKGEKEIVVDPERFDLIRKMFDLMLTNANTPPKILEIANEQWGLRTKAGRKVARSTIYRIFTDPFYYGEFEYPKGSGNWYKGHHQPMITREEYDKIQIFLGRKGKPQPRTHEFPFTGMMQCGECGAMITAEDKIKRQKNGNVHYYTYYHCTKRKDPNCTQKTMRKEELESQIMGVLDTIEIPADFREWALDVIKETNEKEFSDKKVIIEAQQKAYNACVQKLDTLIDMRANKEINEEEFLRKKSEIAKEKERLSELMNDSDGQVDDWMDKATTLFSFAELARFRFENGTLEEKKTILASLGSNLSLKDGILAIELQKPLLTLKETAFEVRQIHERLEPVKSSLDKRKLGEIYAQCPNLLRDQDSNLEPID